MRHRIRTGLSAAGFALAAILFIVAPALAQNTQTVSGNLNDLGAGPAPSDGTSFYRLELINCGENTPRINGAALLDARYKDFIPDGAGAISGVIYRNDLIECGGVTGLTRYVGTPYKNLQKLWAGQRYNIAGTPFNINTEQAESAIPPSTLPDYARRDASNAFLGTQDFEGAAVTRPFRRLAFASFPASCTANREFLERSDPATAGQVIYVCNAAGNGWDLVGDGGGGGGGGITTLNTLTADPQTLAVGTAGTDFNISSATATHTFNLPTASGTVRGALSSADWTTFNNKESALTFSSPLSRSVNTISCPTCELTSNKNAASGYAGLTSGTKLTLGQGQEVWAVADLTDYAAKSGTGTTALGVTLTALAADDVLKWSGTDWVNAAAAPKATALAANGSDCSGNNFALGVDASGAAECAQPDFSNLSGVAADAQIPNNITIDLATTATTANAGDSATGFFPAGALEKARQHAATVYNDQANTYTAGMKQTFQNSAATAGLNLATSADPSAPAQGDLWLNASSLKWRGAAVTSTAVADSRAVNTSAPLGGGGALSADLTLTCATCEVTGNKNAASGYAGLTAGTKLTLAQGQEVWALADLTDVSASTGAGTTVMLNQVPVLNSYTVAGLPAAGTANRIAIVTDAATAGSCTSGGGSARSFCRDTGAAWEPLGDGTSAGGGITTLNTLTADPQTFAVGTAGTDFAISSVTATHTFNLPTASGTVRGALSSADWTTFNNKVPTSITLTAGAGLSGGGDLSASRSFATDSTEADFLASGALTCGAATQGKIKVHTTPLQYCDNAATPALQYAAYGDSAGKATTAALADTATSANAGDSATAFFVAGQVEPARGGTGADSSGSTGVPRVASGTWSFNAAFADLGGTVGDAQIAAGAVDGGSGGEIADGTVDSNDLATANKTLTKSLAIFDPATGDSNDIQMYFGQAVTITRVACSVAAATSVTIQMDERAEATPNTAGTDVMTAALVCDTDSQATTSFTNATIASRVPLNLQITGVSGTPGSVRIHIEYTVD